MLTAVGLRILRCIAAATTAIATLHIAATDHDDFRHRIRTPPLARSLQCFPPSNHSASITAAYTINASLESAIFLVLPPFLPIFWEQWKHPPSQLHPTPLPPSTGSSPTPRNNVNRLRTPTDGGINAMRPVRPIYFCWLLVFWTLPIQ
jgi:hypothetical protein